MFSKEVPAFITSIFPSCLSTMISLDVSSLEESEELFWFYESLELFSSLGELCSLEVELPLLEESSLVELSLEEFIDSLFELVVFTMLQLDKAIHNANNKILFFVFTYITKNIIN